MRTKKKKSESNIGSRFHSRSDFLVPLGGQLSNRVVMDLMDIFRL